MLRRSTSFDTSPMPMKIAMNRPKTAVAASPRSLMILTSCPAVSWPSRYDEAISRTANSDQVVGHAVAHRLAEDADRDPANGAHRRLRRAACARAGAGLRHPLHEEVLERVAQRVERHQRRAGRDQLGQQPLRRRLERQLERVARRARSRSAARTAGATPREHLRREVGDHQLPAVDLEREDVGQAARTPRAGPPATIATRLHSASASARMCELKNTVRP